MLKRTFHTLDFGRAKTKYYGYSGPACGCLCDLVGRRGVLPKQLAYSTESQGRGRFNGNFVFPYQPLMEHKDSITLDLPFSLTFLSSYLIAIFEPGAKVQEALRHCYEYDKR